MYDIFAQKSGGLCRCFSFSKGVFSRRQFSGVYILKKNNNMSSDHFTPAAFFLGGDEILP